MGFFVAGFGVACWAPLVPFAKARLAIDDGLLGLLLLCLGVGSVAAMLITGVLSARCGSRPVILASGFGLALMLPLLTLAGTPLTLGLALLAFGASLGSLDVAVNVHAVEVERAAGRPLMSGFHALFSLGGLAGSAAMTGLLSIGWQPLAASVACALAMLAAMLPAVSRLLRSTGPAQGPLFVRPRGQVLLLAALAAITFLTEGAILDWSALLLTGDGLLPAEQGGWGYLLFSVAMTAGRLTGDAVTARIGDRATLLWGGLITLAGFALLLATPQVLPAMGGFLLIGLGAANLVPVLFRRAGSQRAMPAALAIAAITTTGYAGMLVGPAAVGFVSDATSLRTAFWLLAALMIAVPLSARRATRNDSR
ncbi:MAG TPA: MFS transporter [Burkholderiaceae bacterium]|nr:MFS transporter [Burkholderiaceae bacterium]